MSKDSKLKKLFNETMEAGGLPAFRTAFEQSIGIENGKLNAEKKEVDYKDFEIGRVCQSLMGNDWRNTFEQNWMNASRLKFEGAGSAVMAGDLPYVSAALDVVAGLANARALERPASPEFIYDELCTVTEATGEGGFDIIVRPDGSQPATDLADGQPIPTVKLKGSRIHRNRTKNQGLRTKVNLYTVLDDLTGTLYEAVDEVSNQVLNERERKVFDCLAGVYDVSTVGDGAIRVVQDGHSFYPYLTTADTTPAPDNSALVANYVNAVNADGTGLQDYSVLEKALKILYANKDPFTGLPVQVDLNDLTIWVAPGSVIQMKYLVGANTIWQFNGTGLAAYGKATVTDKNPLAGTKIVTSQVHANRLIDVGIGASSATKLTNAGSDTTHTATSVLSFYMLGHPKKAIRYWQRQPYTVQQVPLSSQEYAEQTVLVQDVRERGSAYWVNPRMMYRAYA